MLLNLDNVSFSYGGQQTLANISFSGMVVYLCFSRPKLNRKFSVTGPCKPVFVVERILIQCNIVKIYKILTY